MHSDMTTSNLQLDQQGVRGTWHYYCICILPDDMYNIPKVVECTQQLNEWVYSGNYQRLLDTPPRELPEFVRRFTQDVYMCVYIQPDAGMYG